MNPQSTSGTVLVRTLGSLALVIVPLLGLMLAKKAQADLPVKVPTHWSSDYPDGYSSTFSFWTVAVAVSAVAVAVAVAAVAVLLRRSFRAAVLRWILGISATVTGAFAAIWIGAVWGTEVSGGADQVHLMWALGPLAVAVVWGIATALLFGKRQDEPEMDQITAIHPERLPSDAPNMWTSDLSSTLMAVLSGVLLLVFALILATMLGSDAGIYGPAIIILSGLCALVLVAGLAWARVRLDHGGLRLESRLFKFTIKRIALVEIVAVAVEPISPGQWGGIGYRVMPGRSAYVVDGGPGLVLDLADGRRFAVEITAGQDAATEGAAVLESLIADALARRS